MNRIFAILFTAVALGLAWALRGHFGHEWGAAWAGATGVLALLAVTGRRDWVRRAPVLAVLGAVGWGAGGMMSYGIVVGYGRSLSFPNALYGYVMLAVIGGLYGFLGGGFLGLGLETEEKHHPDWPRLIAEMFAGGFLVWGFLIYQMEWLMTPPRSELWAAMLGAAGALTWYLTRNGYRRALRVAAYTALGAGSGFALGNFFQTLGAASAISYNWWNVMEFTLGFCGGLAMAWAVLTRDWPESPAPKTSGTWIAAVFVFLFIPFTNLVNSMSLARFIEKAKRLGISHPHTFAQHQMWTATAVMLLFAALLLYLWKKQTHTPEKSHHHTPAILFFTVLLEYILFADIQLLTFFRPPSLKYSDTLYLPIFLLLFAGWFLIFRKKAFLPEDNERKETAGRWMMITGLLIILLLAITFIAVNSHGPLPGAHERFGMTIGN